MTRRLFEVALVDEILAELARQHRTRAVTSHSRSASTSAPCAAA
jgi:hypothetical protein